MPTTFRPETGDRSIGALPSFSTANTSPTSSDAKKKSLYDSTEQRRIAGYQSPLTKGGAPGLAGNKWLTKVLEDPYGFGVTDVAQRQAMEGANKAYGVAEDRARNSIYGAGGEDSGVGASAMGNMELSRAGSLADIMRNWEQYRLALGDDRLRSMLLPYLGLYSGDWSNAQQAYMGKMAQPTDVERYGGMLGGILQGIGSLIPGG